MILNYINNTIDLKNVSLVSTTFHAIVKDKLWRSPCLKKYVTAEDLAELSCLPIKELDMSTVFDIDYSDGWMKVISRFSQLTSLKIGDQYENLNLADDSFCHIAALTSITCLHLNRCVEITANGYTTLINLPLEELVITYLKDAHDNDEIVRIISQIPYLCNLTLDWNKITHEGFAHLSKMSQLLCLKLPTSINMASAGLIHLSSLPLLEEFNISHCRISHEEDFFEILSNMKSLLSLDISYNGNITDYSLECISKMSNVKSLNLQHCSGFASAGLRHLAQLPLTCLSIGSTDADDACLHAVSKIGSLRSLDISSHSQSHISSRVTDIGISYLSHLSHLRTLKINSCDRITSHGLSQLNKLPLEALSMLGIYLERDLLEVVAKMAKLKLLNISKSRYLPKCDVENLNLQCPLLEIISHKL